MSFSFGFDDEDIDTTGEVQASVPRESSRATDADASPAAAAKLVDFRAVLHSFTNVPISTAVVDVHGTRVHKRELYDVRHQLMAEDSTGDGSDSTGDSAEATLNVINGAHDLEQFVYEGGFKTWECSIDLVAKLQAEDPHAPQPCCVVELGCGTTLPGCYVLQQWLQRPENPNSALDLVLTDYNESVLRLVTVPNLVANWYFTVSAATRARLQQTFQFQADPETEFQMTKELIDEFCAALDSRGIRVTLVAGAWSPQFTQLLPTVSPCLVLSSETIYSEHVTLALSRVLQHVLQQSSSNRCLVAAKDIYFGVGGTVLGFLDCMAGYQCRVEKIVEKGVKRSIIEITNT